MASVTNPVPPRPRQVQITDDIDKVRMRLRLTGVEDLATKHTALINALCMTICLVIIWACLLTWLVLR